MGDMREYFDDLKQFKQERRDKLEPNRMEYAEKLLLENGVLFSIRDYSTIIIHYNKNNILFYPYTGWFTGKGIKDGRGIKNLLKQLN